MIGHEHVIYPTTKYVVRCPATGCGFTCTHPTLPTATGCMEEHNASHHGGPR